MRHALEAILLAAFAMLLAQRTEAAEEIDITGHYKCQGRTMRNESYTGRTVIDKKNDTYQIAWTVGREAYFGEGIREGNLLSVGWLLGQPRIAGLTVFKIEDGPKLTGKWTVLGGRGTLLPETLTFVERLKPKAAPNKKQPQQDATTLEIRLDRASQVFAR